jgi:hypothetical protein
MGQLLGQILSFRGGWQNWQQSLAGCNRRDYDWNRSSGHDWSRLPPEDVGRFEQIGKISMTNKEQHRTH